MSPQNVNGIRETYGNMLETVMKRMKKCSGTLVLAGINSNIDAKIQMQRSAVTDLYNNPARIAEKNILVRLDAVM